MYSTGPAKYGEWPFRSAYYRMLGIFAAPFIGVQIPKHPDKYQELLRGWAVAVRLAYLGSYKRQPSNWQCIWAHLDTNAMPLRSHFRGLLHKLLLLLHCRQANSFNRQQLQISTNCLNSRLASLYYYNKTRVRTGAFGTDIGSVACASDGSFENASMHLGRWEEFCAADPVAQQQLFWMNGIVSACLVTCLLTYDAFLGEEGCTVCNGLLHLAWVYWRVWRY